MAQGLGSFILLGAGWGCGWGAGCKAGSGSGFCHQIMMQIKN